MTTAYHFPNLDECVARLPENPTWGKFLSLFRRAEEGDEVAGREVRRLLEINDAFWQPVGEIGAILEERMIDVVAGDSRLQRWSTEEFTKGIRVTLLALGDSPMEQYLIHRIVVAHLKVRILQIRLGAARSETAIGRCQKQLDNARHDEKVSVMALGDYRNSLWAQAM